MSQTDRTSGLVGHLGIKAPVRAATTANITLSGLQTVDGVVLVAEDRLLVKNQTTDADNGIYVADTGVWERAKDFNGTYDIVKGTMVRVTDGSTLSDSYWAVSTANPITIGTTSISFTQVNNALLGVSAFIQTLLDDANEAVARATLLIETMSTVASATSPDIWTGTGHLINYTGSATATSFPAAPQAGAARELLCAGAAVFTTGANFVVAGGSFTAAAGDRILVVAETTTKFRLYRLSTDGALPLSGGTLTGTLNGTIGAFSAAVSGTTGTFTGELSGATAAGAMLASQAEQETGTALDKLVTSGRQPFHPLHPKAFIAFNGTGTPAVLASYNMDGATPITDNGVGDYSLNFGTDFSTANYSASGLVQGDITSNTGRTASVAHKLGGTLSAATFQAGVSQGVRFDIASGGSPLDSAYVSVQFLGDHA